MSLCGPEDHQRYYCDLGAGVILWFAVFYVYNSVNKLWITLTCGVSATVDNLWITFANFHNPQLIHRPNVVHSLYISYPQLET
jgi:hypothetical protein